jgi:hypothetical protein
MTARQRVRRSERRSSFLIAATFMAILVGCGEPPEKSRVSSMPDATTTSPGNAFSDPVISASRPPERRVEAASVNASTGYTPGRSRPSASAGTPTESIRRDALASFELVGTGIDGTKAFAIVRTPDDGVVTVHEGGSIGGYSVRSIQPDRIRLKGQDGKDAMLVIGASASADRPSPSSTDMTPSEASAVRAFIANGINTDQSIPEHVVYGPTARWPEGVKHVH